MPLEVSAYNRFWAVLSQNATVLRNVNPFCKLLITLAFISQKSLDTPVFWLIRFRQKVLTESKPPLELFFFEEKAAQLPGGLFVLCKLPRRCGEIRIEGTLAIPLRIICCELLSVVAGVQRRHHVLRWMWQCAASKSGLLRHVRKARSGTDWRGCRAIVARTCAEACPLVGDPVVCFFGAERFGWTDSGDPRNHAVSALARDERCATGCSSWVSQRPVYLTWHSDPGQGGAGIRGRPRVAAC